MSVSVLQLPPLPKNSPPKPDPRWKWRVLAVLLMLASILFSWNGSASSNEYTFKMERLNLTSVFYRKVQDIQHKQWAAWKQEQTIKGKKEELVCRQAKLSSEGESKEAQSLQDQIERQEICCQKAHMESESFVAQLSDIRGDYICTSNQLFAQYDLRVANGRLVASTINLVAFIVGVAILILSFLPSFFARPKSPETPAV